MRKQIFAHGLLNFFIVVIIAAALHRIIPIYFYISVLSAPIAGLVGYFQFKYFIKSNISNCGEIRRLILPLFISTTSLLSFSFHSTVPLNVDRSFSVWMINQVATHPKQNTKSQIEKNAAKFFSPSGGEIARRIDEQASLGNIKDGKSIITLTSRGKRIWRINQIVSRFFGLNSKYSG